MARYKLVSVKFSRREHKKDAQGNLMYRDEDKKQPVYEVKHYDIGDTVDLTPAEAERLRKDIQPVGGTRDHPTPLQFVPDDERGKGKSSSDDDGEDDDESDEIDPKLAAVLSGNVDQVLAYIRDHEDDDETLEALREAEMASNKPRKGVLDAINDLLGE